MSGQRSERMDGPDCRRVIYELHFFIDDELTVEHRTVVAGHLEHCGPCRTAFEFETCLKAFVARHAGEQPPSQLVARVRQALGLDR